MTGGPFGTIRFKAEQAHGASSGIEIATRLLEPIKEQFPTLSYADFYQVTGGPEVPFHLGRQDKPEPPVEGRLPDATKDIVALSGDHSVNTRIFDNSYFTMKMPSLLIMHAVAHLKLSELETKSTNRVITSPIRLNIPGQQRGDMNPTLNLGNRKFSFTADSLISAAERSRI
ncbi:hypothetical protein M9H77_16029 [Catharanthus roseus]|uniref:Uncharacterized protein n=1 Tax=Catharanthus roseus TaxID=4058 RepID=A0ACC0AZJ6_CATRO|nr:hypothetical protein M9H77_16029 [Catharanthus roseus]